MDGTTLTGGAFLPDPGPTWHVAASGRFQRRRQVRHSLAARQRLAGDLDHGRHHAHWRCRPARCWAHVACRCGGRFQRRRQVRHSLAARQRLAGDLDHGRHHAHWRCRSCPMLGPRGMSLRRPISTATASPTFFGRTTAACRRSGPWTAPRSLALLSCPMLGPRGMSLRRPISTATASPTFFGRTTAACRRSGPWTAPRSLAAGCPARCLGPRRHVAAAADFNGDGKSDILWQHDSGLPADLDHGRHHGHWRDRPDRPG